MIYEFGHLAGLNGPSTDFRMDVDISNSNVSHFNPESQDIELANKMAREIINISGIPVEIYIRTDNEDFDKVWGEDPNPTYWPADILKGFYVPQPAEVELTKWGLDTKLSSEIVFCRAEIYNLYSERLLRPGDVIKIPYMSMSMPFGHFLVKNAQEFGTFRYHWLYVKCHIETLHADITVIPPGDDNVQVNPGLG